jgi:hypothetical protein
MTNPRDRAKERRPIRVGMNAHPSKKPFDPTEEIARLHTLWVKTGGAEGEPDDDKISMQGGARDAKGNVRPEAIKNLRTDVDHGV